MLAGTSLWVRMRTTPGIFSASDVSTERMRAWSCGLRTILRWSVPGKLRSA